MHRLKTSRRTGSVKATEADDVNTVTEGRGLVDMEVASAARVENVTLGIHEVSTIASDTTAGLHYPRG